MTHRPRTTGLLHPIFEAQADLRPDATAVVHGGARQTYGDLERRANLLAAHLRALGAGRESRVAILLPRSIEAYAAILGTLKAGAAYVPIDPGWPPERADFILRDCGACALVSTTGLARPHARFGGAVVRVDADRDAIAARRAERTSPAAIGLGPRDLCYVIYTSGSTGRPKGVMVEHRNAAHLVRAEGDLFAVRPEDRVYQGFSLAFDASVEEIWLAFHAGATLVAATPEMAHAGPDLARLLAESGVTVLSCVPTLLAMLDEDIPTLRLLIFGGEACDEGLVERWARPGRRLVNTYGPTEATVIATWADLAPGRPVTIGRPLPGYQLQLLDERSRQVARGAVGEICIGGAGVARGYLGDRARTGACFIRDPSAVERTGAARLYRTGDLGRLDESGDLRFLGRADGQVKIRGFRVELGEVEAALRDDGVRAAACALREEARGVTNLVAYVVPRDGRRVDEKRLRDRVRARLPEYMVPSRFEAVADLPRLASGKVDRAALSAGAAKERARPGVVAPTTTASRAASGRTSADLPRTATERHLVEVWRSLLPSAAISIHDDFFRDLGGHSLLAARMVSLLRRDPRFARISMVDVYACPTIATLAAAIDRQAGERPPAAAPAPARPARDHGGAERGGRSRHVRAGFAQAAGLYFVYGARALQVVGPYLVFLLMARDHPAGIAAAWAAAAAVAVQPFLLAVAVAAKWALLGHIEAGRHPVWGGYYLRFWLVRGLVAALPLEPLRGTPLLPRVFRLFGARIGSDVYLDTYDLAAFDLIRIGDGSSVDTAASLLGCAVEGDRLVVGPIVIGRACFVGARSVLREHTEMEDGARLEDQSLLPAGARVPAGRTWAGSPARPSAARPPVLPPRPARAPLARVATEALYAVLVMLVSLVGLAAFVPGLAILTRIDPLSHPFLYLGVAPLVGASFVIVLTATVAALKWLLVGRVRPGMHPVHGAFYVRKWFVDQLLGLGLHALGSLHATLYMPAWYRALGARIGRFVELSTAASVTPDLLELADGATIADEASLSAARIEGGWMTLAPTRLGRRAFVGNGAVVPPGVAMADGSLVGVVSIAPAEAERAARPGAAWLGSPPILLPRRQASPVFPDTRTYAPTRRLWLARGAFEVLRATLPPAGFVLAATTTIVATLALLDHVGPAAAIALLPVVHAACCVALIGCVAVAKWAVMGRFRRFEVPLWSWFVWRLELINALYEFMLAPLALEALHGTPFLPWSFRLFGARIGRRTYFHTTGLIEFDLVEVGDRAAMNDECVLQTHLFEDRVLKAAPLRIGRDCTVGAGSVVLYDTTMEDRSRLDGLSLLMKGERLPAGTAWAGSPAIPAPARLRTAHALPQPRDARRRGGEHEEERHESPERAVAERYAAGHPG